MSLTGARLSHPVLGIELIATEVDEAQGTRLVVDYTIQPHHPRSELRHVHETWTEDFEIKQGSARYEVDGRERHAHAGDMIHMPRGVPHLHPWNVGDEPLVMRQVSTLDPPSPAALRDVAYGFATLYGLAGEGHCNAKGDPTLLQGAATIRSFHPHGIFLSSPPRPVQRVMFGLLALIGKAVGVRPYYDRFVEPMSGASSVER
jgi:mannose-6-phosphate isomerase-like protein (cupin superfamily)